MPKKTIAEMRAEEVVKLAKFKTATPTEADIQEARRNMNSFYRLAALDWRVSELENDPWTANRYSTKREAERAYNWFIRLDKVFSETYGLRIEYGGPLPSIGVTLPGGGFAEKISRYFYE